MNDARRWIEIWHHVKQLGAIAEIRYARVAIRFLITIQREPSDVYSHLASR
jgi:hypothetical protein